MALKHRSDLPEEITTALARRFQSRVEQSVRHLIIDWPSVPNNVLYRLRDPNNNEDSDDKMVADLAAFNTNKSIVPSIISGSSGDSGSLSSSRSFSSLSPHTQAGAAFPAMRKSPMDAALTNDSNDSGENTPAATVSPDDSETAPNQPCMFLRL